MRSLQTARPRRELAGFVRAFVQREIRCNDGQFSQPNIATLEQVLAFDFSDQLILEHPNGQDTLCPRINLWGSLPYPGVASHFHSHTVGFAIFLRPWASWRLFRIPPSVIAGRVIDGGDLVGQNARDLWAKMAERESFSDRVRFAEEYLLPYALDAIACNAITNSVRYIVHRRGAVRVEELASQSALSTRQYERRFAEEMGLSPKLFARTARFQLALDAKRLTPLRSWLSIAHALHYSDQMHMIRDFRKLAGESPSQLIGRVWDLQPWSLATESNDEA